jgi:hypothetical protein
VKGPLTQFQDTKLTRDDLLQLVQNLNAGLGEVALKETQVERTFDLVWPKLEERIDLNKLPSDGPTDKPERKPDDLLTEILDTVRSTSQENFRLLKFAIDGIVSVSEKIPTPVPGYLDSFKGLAGIATLQTLNRLTALADLAKASGADASTSGDETPVVSPASQPEKPEKKGPGKT